MMSLHASSKSLKTPFHLPLGTFFSGLFGITVSREILMTIYQIQKLQQAL